MFGFIRRLYSILNPPKVKKVSNPIRFGILGAATIAPFSLTLTVASHPECIVLGVAARDEKRAKAFAKKHQIPKVYYGPTGYQDLINDPEIDVIYNPLPNSLHFEWTVKALEAGKHVLLEKPATNTVQDTQKLFELAAKKNLVLLEGLHHSFYPAFLRIQEIIQSGELGKIKAIKSMFCVPRGIILDNNIRFDYSLGGGTLMDMGAYPIAAARTLTGTEPVSVLNANYVPHPNDPSRIDRAVDGVFAFPNDITAEFGCDLQLPPRFGFIPQLPKIYIQVQLEGGEISLSNFTLPYLTHTITVKPKSGKKRTEVGYKFKDGRGEEWWTSYRYQLEAFIDKLKGREPKVWITAEDSINQMKAVEMVYNKLGLPIRPNSTYVPSDH